MDQIMIANTLKGDVEYAVSGIGSPLLFLHGGHSNCRETLFHKGFDKNRYQLITPSRPGYGNTPLNDHVTPRKTADLLLSLLDYLRIDQVVVYAVSAAGLTSIELAAGYPERVEKLILASAVSKKWLDKEDHVYKMAKRLFNPNREMIVWQLIRSLSKISPKMIASHFYAQFSKDSTYRLEMNEIREFLSTLQHYRSKTGFMCDIEHDIDEESLTLIQCPTLIIHSRNDNTVSFEHAENAHKMIKGSKLIAIENAWGHLFWIGKDANESIRKTVEFIAQ